MQHMLLLVLYTTWVYALHMSLFSLTPCLVMCGMPLNHCIAIFVSTLYSNHILFPKYDFLLCLRTVVISLYLLFGKYVFTINYRNGVNTIL